MKQKLRSVTITKIYATIYKAFALIGYTLLTFALYDMLYVHHINLAYTINFLIISVTIIADLWMMYELLYYTDA